MNEEEGGVLGSKADRGQHKYFVYIYIYIYIYIYTHKTVGTHHQPDADLQLFTVYGKGEEGGDRVELSEVNVVRRGIKGRHTDSLSVITNLILLLTAAFC